MLAVADSFLAHESTAGENVQVAVASVCHFDVVGVKLFVRHLPSADGTQILCDKECKSQLKRHAVAPKSLCALTAQGLRSWWTGRALYLSAAHRTFLCFIRSLTAVPCRSHLVPCI
jgi:hypothetical protein